jgi:hypothetical protein
VDAIHKNAFRFVVERRIVPGRLWRRQRSVTVEKLARGPDCSLAADPMGKHPMAKRVLNVEWRSRPTANGRERLARAVSWMVHHATREGQRAAGAAPSEEQRMETLLEEANR